MLQQGATRASIVLQEALRAPIVLRRPTTLTHCRPVRSVNLEDIQRPLRTLARAVVLASKFPVRTALCVLNVHLALTACTQARGLVVRAYKVNILQQDQHLALIVQLDMQTRIVTHLLPA